MDDLYIKRIKKELDIYKNDLNVHDLPLSAHYINNKFLCKEIAENTKINNFDQLFYNTVDLCRKKYSEVKVLCIGSGNCDIEINYAINTPSDVTFTCIDINPDMLERGKQNAFKLNILLSRINFIVNDINKMSLPEKAYNIIFVSQALHHFVELEHIFEEISKAMKCDGYFMVNDMIGRNGHLIYDNTYILLNKIWEQIPYEFKINRRQGRYFKNRIQWDCSGESFEGIRAQDILPLLYKNFKFEVFIPFYTLIQYFIDRDFGFNFDPDKNYDRALLEYIWALDIYCLKNKLLGPTQMWAVMRSKDESQDLDFRYLFHSPEDVLNICHSDFADILNNFSKIPTHIQGLYNKIPIRIVHGKSFLTLSIFSHGATIPHKINANKDDMRLIGVALKSIVVRKDNDNSFYI